MKLTTSTVAALALPHGKSDHIEWCDAMPGFGVRLRGTTKRWVIQYRIGQQQRRESLGDVRKVKLDDARTIARNRFAQIQLGTDPGAEKAKARETANVVKLTLGNVARNAKSAEACAEGPAQIVQHPRWHTAKPLT